MHFNQIELLRRLSQNFESMQPGAKLLITDNGTKATVSWYGQPDFMVDPAILPELFRTGCFETSDGQATTYARDGQFVITRHGDALCNEAIKEIRTNACTFIMKCSGIIPILYEEKGLWRHWDRGRTIFDGQVGVLFERTADTPNSSQHLIPKYLSVFTDKDVVEALEVSPFPY